MKGINLNAFEQLMFVTVQGLGKAFDAYHKGLTHAEEKFDSVYNLIRDPAIDLKAYEDDVMPLIELMREGYDDYFVEHIEKPLKEADMPTEVVTAMKIDFFQRVFAASSKPWHRKFDK